VATLRDTINLTVRRAGVAKGQCIRVTPSLYTRDEDLEPVRCGADGDQPAKNPARQTARAG